MKSKKDTVTSKDLHPDQCKICYSPFSDTSLQCKDRYCKKCILEYLKLKIIEGQVLRILCPSCNLKIKEETIKKIVSPDLFSKYEKFLSFRKLLKNKDIKLCPKPDCIGFDEMIEKETHLICHVCSFKFCPNCFGSAHSGSCQKQRFGYENIVKKTGIKSCPWCRALVSRCGGSCCVKCAFCSFEWCWICERKYTDIHSPVNCLVGYELTDVYWKSLAIFLTFPLSFFYLFFFYFWYKSQQNKLWKCLNKNKTIFMVFSFVFSPLLTVLILPIIINSKVTQYLFSYFHIRSDKYHRRGYKLKITVIFAISLPFNIVMFLAFSLICFVFLPLIGLLLIVAKLFKKGASKNDSSPKSRRNLVKNR